MNTIQHDHLFSKPETIYHNLIKYLTKMLFQFKGGIQEFDYTPYIYQYQTTAFGNLGTFFVQSLTFILINTIMNSN